MLRVQLASVPLSSADCLRRVRSETFCSAANVRVDCANVDVFLLVDDVADVAAVGAENARSRDKGLQRQ